MPLEAKSRQNNYCHTRIQQKACKSTLGEIPYVDIITKAKQSKSKQTEAKTLSKTKQMLKQIPTKQLLPYTHKDNKTNKLHGFIMEYCQRIKRIKRPQAN